MDIDHKHIHTLFLNYKHGYDRKLQGKIWHILHMQGVYSSRPVLKKKITTMQGYKSVQQESQAYEISLELHTILGISQWPQNKINKKSANLTTNHLSRNN
jgi:hypothetical protein